MCVFYNSDKSAREGVFYNIDKSAYHTSGIWLQKAMEISKELERVRLAREQEGASGLAGL